MCFCGRRLPPSGDERNYSDNGKPAEKAERHYDPKGKGTVTPWINPKIKAKLQGFLPRQI